MMIDSEFLNAVLSINISKVKLQSTIVSAADSKFFKAIQALTASLKSSHEVELIVCDLGLTKSQMVWLEKQGAILFKPKLKVSKSVFYWQTWNKPFYLEQVYSRVKKPLIWIDADCIVTGSLETLDKLTQKQFMVFADTASIKYHGFVKGSDNVTNEDYLYERYPVVKRFLPGECPNAGVVGLNLGRSEDKWIHKYWSFMIQQSMKSNKLFNRLKTKSTNYRNTIAWYDQGCLQWALEKIGKTYLVSGDEKFNDPCALVNIASYKEFLYKLNEVVSITNTRICHFPSGSKPYHKFPRNFNPDIVEFSKNRNDLTLYVLGHTDIRPKTSKIVKYTHLPDILKDNDLAESRFFLTNKIELTKTNYIGLASARWDEKYKDKCLPLDKLHRLPMNISRVWAAYKSDENWLWYTKRDHPGMEKYIKYLIDQFHLDIEREVPWSNNFIAHRLVVSDLQRWILNCLSLLRTKFGINIYNYGMKGFDNTRKGSYLAERISMLFFCMRNDLTIKQIPLIL